MREIKFRGKVARDGKWIYGDLAHIWDEENGNFIPAISQLGDYTSSVEPETIGQFTGLKDKNGKEIYEGDLIKTIYNDSVYEVQWNDMLTGFIPLIRYVHEVIGNIYENPKQEGGK